MSSLPEISFRIPNVLTRNTPSQILEAPIKNMIPRIESYNWLQSYEKLEGSIFKYYNVQNEVDFLKKKDDLSDEKKQYYLQENVKRFLGEFVGKIPYSTIPYEVDSEGISYAGIHVMDSYRKAAQLGGEREQAEIQGFQDIESTYSQAIEIQSYLKKSGKLPTGVWISPPKIADYGFVFLFSPDNNGHIKEYILRYPEPINELKKSKDIYMSLSSSPPPQKTDDFLTLPLFDRSNQDSTTILDTVMSQMNISQKDIQKSHAFENIVESSLSEWIQSYSALIQSLTSYENGSPFYKFGVLEAKKKLLAIYQKAEEIKLDLDSSSSMSINHEYTAPLSTDNLWNYVAALQNQSKDLPSTSGGSCPAIQNNEDPFASPLSFMDNLTALKTLVKGIPLENAHKNAESFPCPKCGNAIPSGKGLEQCPNCKITKQEYAKMVSGSQCD